MELLWGFWLDVHPFRCSVGLTFWVLSNLLIYNMVACSVREVHGLYGSFTLSERVIQKIWLRRDFALAGARTAAGQTLEVLDPGRWNLQEGPDFKGARLRIGARELRGDVEIHFNAGDWRQHAHQCDANFDGVVLHVVLYPADAGSEAALTSAGSQPETLVLLPLLERDLESYAMDEALRDMEQVDDLEWMVEFLALPRSERQSRLEQEAAERWRQKLDFARQRLAAVEWAPLCHQMCLEVLGYSRNRAVMGRIALKYPLSDFQSGELSVDSLLQEFAPYWRLNGLRPANHPQQRLRQYLAVVAAQPEWPLRLAELLRALPLLAVEREGTRSFRKHNALAQLQQSIAAEVFSDKISTGKLNTLVCDALLPLAAAADLCDAEPYWWHWYPGDAPDALRRFLKQAQLTDYANPQSNGATQGALALFLRRSL